MSLKEYFTIETFEACKPSPAEIVALKNLVLLTRERLWLAENFPRKPAISIEFDEVIREETKLVAEQSIVLANAYVNRANDYITRNR